ncbi:hypothetical protein [Dokdonella sp.]|uniref:hypothetical protein n=1 Tax=Dokdonella sp. TaxID=2291710 RepID=UPI0025C2C9BC|nr:hypothetical protein [Dokdonella sp.]MBX3691718.1 hypothetical protein [Dokdonella sp.]
MTPEIKDQIRQASENLKIQDIVLFECRLERPERDPAKLAATVTQEHKRQVRYFSGRPESGGEEAAILQVLVSLGTRLVPPSSEGEEETEPFFLIEADFLVVYEMKADIDQECIKAFADNNAVHNVWPFWRQHVFDMVSRARLPHLEIPLYSGFKM